MLAVTQGGCEGVDVPGFWQAMGMEKAHEGLRAGSIFSLVAADQNLEVLIAHRDACMTSSLRSKPRHPQLIKRPPSVLARSWGNCLS